MDLTAPPASPLLEYRATLMLYLQRRFKMSRREARTLLASWLEEVDPSLENAAARTAQPLAR